jgi:hypothetical protein
VLYLKFVLEIFSFGSFTHGYFVRFSILLTVLLAYSGTCVWNQDFGK